MAQVQSINFILIYHHRNYWLRQKAIQEKSFFWQNPIWGKICHHLRNLDYCIFTTREIDFILIWCLLWHNLVGKIRNGFGTFFTYFPHIEKNLRKVNWSFLLKYFNWFEYYFWYFKPNKEKNNFQKSKYPTESPKFQSWWILDPLKCSNFASKIPIPVKYHILKVIKIWFLRKTLLATFPYSENTEFLVNFAQARASAEKWFLLLAFAYMNFLAKLRGPQGVSLAYLMSHHPVWSLENWSLLIAQFFLQNVSISFPSSAAAYGTQRRSWIHLSSWTWK